MIAGQRGIGLAETLVAVAILGTCVVAFVVALSTGSLAVGEHSRETTAQSLAQSQIEHTKNYAFRSNGVYPTITAPVGYTITVGASSVAGADTNMQKITVTVLLNGSSLFQVSDYKVNR
ncbi:MAG: hypothetical protein A2Y90_05220 [Chloroflexi bacterium RBG_13_52_12]|nr:MAG: hypothetical protein A2Y90_05220 [Chloroflexi bacterium RBG_13_52_12]